MHLIVISVLLSFLSLLEIRNREIHLDYNIFFKLNFLVLTFILCFRYGQGTDYAAYESAYEVVRVSSISLYDNVLEHGEVGWYTLMYFANKLDISFEGFVFTISLTMMAFTYKTINKFSPYKNFSLLLLLPTYYLTYYYSGIRQGLAVSIFAYLGIDFLCKRRYYLYFVTVFLLSSIHTSMVFMAVAPFALAFVKDKNKLVLLTLSVCASFLVYYSDVIVFIQHVRGTYFYTEPEVSILAFSARLILFFIVYRMHMYIRNNNHSNIYECHLYNFYVICLLFFFLLHFYLHLSQRLTVGFKIAEILLIPVQIHIINKINKEKFSRLIQKKESCYKIVGFAIVVIMMANVELVKNIDSFIHQKPYYEWVNVTNYPYISIFNKLDINKYIKY